MYLGFSFPYFPNLATPFQGDTFINTLSPTSKDNGLSRLFAYDKDNMFAWAYNLPRARKCLAKPFTQDSRLAGDYSFDM